MLLGFISLLLTVSQNRITKICVPVGWTHHMLPCSLADKESSSEEGSKTPTSHFQTFFSFSGTAKRLLAEENNEPATEAKSGYCTAKVLKITGFNWTLSCRGALHIIKSACHVIVFPFGARF